MYCIILCEYTLESLEGTYYPIFMCGIFVVCNVISLFSLNLIPTFGIRAGSGGEIEVHMFA